MQKVDSLHEAGEIHDPELRENVLNRKYCDQCEEKASQEKIHGVEETWGAVFAQANENLPVPAIEILILPVFAHLEVEKENEWQEEGQGDPKKDGDHSVDAKEEGSES